MSEERLQEIKDSVDFQREILLAQNLGTLCVDEEQELIDEIERLNNIIDKINKLYDCNTHCENIYHAIGVVLNKEYCDIEDVSKEDLLEILKGSDKK